MRYALEICTSSLQSVINAAEAGANRIELCDNLWEGGTTPSMASIEIAKKYIPVFVLIRPRGGDFVYSDREFELMKRDIHWAKKAGADGIVSGVLLPDGNVDVARTRELVAATGPLPFTFHRAFDLTPDPEQALEAIINCGAHRILTSGQKSSALEGSALLNYLVQKAGNRIGILPGGGINTENIATLAESGCKEFHLSAKSYVKGKALHLPKTPMNSSKDIPEDKIAVSDVTKIKKIKSILDSLP